MAGNSNYGKVPVIPRSSRQDCAVGWTEIGERILILGFLLSLLVPSARASGLAGQTKHCSGRQAAEPFVDKVFLSESLNRDMHYRVLLPRGYRTGTEHFAVLYLLHGLYGDYKDWTTNTRLENYARPFPLLIVMPDAGDSWYTNSATVPDDRFEDYVVKDLIPEIDSHFRTVQTRSGRAIAGLSMGGYGAVKFALKYAQLFAFAGSLSGAFDAPLGLDTRVPEFRPKLLPVFGPAGDPVRSTNDLFQLLDQVAADRLPYLYIQCGTEDGFLPINRDFVSGLPKRKITFEYHETPGGHSWEYWDRSVQDLLHSLSKIIQF